jgi:hypothetical protein
MTKRLAIANRESHRETKANKTLQQKPENVVDFKWCGCSKHTCLRSKEPGSKNEKKKKKASKVSTRMNT